MLMVQVRESQLLTSCPNSALLAGVSVSGMELHGVNASLKRLRSRNKQRAELGEGGRGGKLRSQPRVRRLLQGRNELKSR